RDPRARSGCPPGAPRDGGRGHGGLLPGAAAPAAVLRLPRVQGGRLPAIRAGRRRDPGVAHLPRAQRRAATVRRRHDRSLLPHLRSERLMPATTRPGPRTPVWADLTAHATRLAAVPVQELFERDPGRFERLSREQAGLLIDFSRQRLDEIAFAKLFQLAAVEELRQRALIEPLAREE